MTPSVIVWLQSLHLGHGMSVSKEEAELAKRLSTIVGVPVCVPLTAVKWITVPSPTYIPVILEYEYAT